MARKVIPLSKRQDANTVTLPAPIGGWNARDALAEMEITDAVSMMDWFPLPSAVMLRKGYTRYATGISGQVETLMSYSGATTSKFMGINGGGNVYDITSTGAVGAASLTGLTNGRFQYVNNTTAGGNYLQMVNSADKMRVFDGAAWHKDGDGPPYDVTGFDTSTAQNISLFKTRVFFIANNSLKVWYLPQNSIGGAATSLDMSSIAQKGGTILAMGEWTLDAGYGVDDLAVFVTSKGEFMVWRLTDPTTPSGISLVGLWALGTPIGKRCMLKWGGDILIITQDGVVPLSKYLISSRLNPKTALTDKIQQAMSDAVTSYSTNFGWELKYYPKANQLYLNVPISAGSSQQQYVMNTITGSWGQFTGYGANCFEIYNDNLYFGGNGFVGQAWNTFSDNSAQIQGNVLQAFSSFGDDARVKQFLMIRPMILTDGTPQISGSVNADFDTSLATTPLSFSPTTYAVWDTATWDNGIWSGGLQVQRQWQGASGSGYWGAPQLAVRSSGIETRWVSTDVRMRRGFGI